MAIRVQRHANVSKQATFFDGLGVSPLKWRVCGCGLNRLVHEGMNNISNVKVHSKNRSGNINIYNELSRLYKEQRITRRMAENGFAPPPLGNFADISYLVEN